MKKRMFISLACALLLSGAAYAKSLVLTLGDGTLVYYLLGGEVNPKLHLTDDGLIVNADSYQFGDVKNLYISNEDDPNGIERVLAGEGVEMRDNLLVIPTAKAVQVYSATGKRVEAKVDVHSGYTTVDLAALPQGAYIVSMGDTSIKVMKK